MSRRARDITVRVRVPPACAKGGVDLMTSLLAPEEVSFKIDSHGTPATLKQLIEAKLKVPVERQTLQTGGTLGPVMDDQKGFHEQGVTNGTLVELSLQEDDGAGAAEAVPIDDVSDLSDDDGLMAAEAEADEPLPTPDKMDLELSDDQMDELGALKQRAADAAEDGDLKAAISGLTGAILLGNPTALILCRRAEILLKLKRPHAAASDASAALNRNPDSAKAFRIRGRARRLLGEYEAALGDLAQAQKIDFDDSTEDVLRYVQRRCRKLDAMKRRGTC